MNFTKQSVKEIKEHIISLNEEEQLKCLKYLDSDKRKTIQLLVKKYQKLLTKKSAEKQRLLKLWDLEKSLYQQNFKYIAGIDEAGRGPLAGPVVAGAVILPPYCMIEGLDDSKSINEKKRQQIADEIKKSAISWAVGVVDAQTIDKLNILESTRYAMKLALDALGSCPQYVLIDGYENPLIKLPQSGVIKGDALSASIAAASIIAKVYRDKLMCIYDKLFPNYCFSIHKGYGTKKHLEILKNIGPSPIHRVSFGPVKKTIENFNVE